MSGFLILYGFVALGELLLPVLAAIQLAGGYLLLVILFRVVSAVERAVGAYERRVDLLAAETDEETVESETAASEASADDSGTDHEPDGSADA